MIRMFGKKYDNIYLCGVCTDICVLNTALLTIANNLNNVYVISDLCAGTNVENHQKALDLLEVNCVKVIKSEEV